MARVPQGPPDLMRDPVEMNPPSVEEGGAARSSSTGGPEGPRTTDPPRPRPGTPEGDQERGGAGGTRPDPLPTPPDRLPEPGPGSGPGAAPGSPRGSGGRLTGPPGPEPGNPGGRPRGPGNARVAMAAPQRLPDTPRQRGDGAGSGPYPATDLGGGSGDLLGRPPASIADLPAGREGLAGGSELPGNGKPAPLLPESPGSIGPAPSGIGVTEQGPGIPLPQAGGTVLGAPRPRGTSAEEGGTGRMDRLVRGGLGGLGTLPGPGNGAGRAGEGPGGSGGGSVAGGNDGGSGGGGFRAGVPGLPGAIGGGGEGGTGRGFGTGVGDGPGGPGGLGTARDFGGLRRGDGGTGGAGADLPPGIGDGSGIGNQRGTGGIDLPSGAGGLGGDGPGGRGSGPGGEGTGNGSRRAPAGVYISTTGSFALPSAITGSNYTYHDHARRKILEEINSRTKLRVSLGGQYRVIRSGLLRNSPVLVFNGHRAFRLTDEQREELRRYVAAGGMIWADLSGAAFDQSFRDEMARTFGRRAESLAISHPIYRSYYVLLDVPRGDTGRNEAFQAITLDGRVAVLMTPNRYLASVIGPPHTDEETAEGALQAVINIYVYAAASFRAEQEE